MALHAVGADRSTPTVGSTSTTRCSHSRLQAVEKTLEDGTLTSQNPRFVVWLVTVGASLCWCVFLAASTSSVAAAGRSAAQESGTLAPGAGRSVYFEAIRNFMPEDNPGSLTAAETRDVLAYILSANEVPGGETDMPEELADLLEIRMTVEVED